MEHYYRETQDENMQIIRELTSSNNSQSYNEQLMLKELVEERAKN